MMITYYNFQNNQLNNSLEDLAKWIAVNNPTSHEVERLGKYYDIPLDMFVTQYFPENMTEIEHFNSETLGNCAFLVLINYKTSKPHSIEKGLYPITFIYNKEKMISITDKRDVSITPSIKKDLSEAVQPSQLIVGCILNMYQIYTVEINRLKRAIDEISERARSTTKREVLTDLADVERDMVFLEQTLVDQKATIEKLLASELFQSMATEERHVREIKRKIKKTDKLISLNRDLIDTTGGLISDMLDSKLNGIMEYLDSAQLVIAIPTLIFSLWGINTGGLIGKDTPLGSLSVVIFAILLGWTTYLYLKKKEY